MRVQAFFARPCQTCAPLPSLPFPCRARFLAAPLFAAVTAALAAYLSWAMTSDAKSKGLANAYGSYGDVFLGGKQPLPPREWDP